jgi:hypothetical protein
MAAKPKAKAGAAATAAPGPSAEEARACALFSLTEVAAANAILKDHLVTTLDDATSARAARERAEREAAEYSTFASREIRARDDELKAAKAALAALAASSAEALAAARAEADEAAASAAADAARVEFDLRRALGDAEARANAMAKAAELSDSAGARVIALTEELAAARAGAAADYGALERKFLQAQKDTERAMDVFRAQVRMEAEKAAIAGIAGAQRRILVENKEMAAALVSTSTETRLAALRHASLADERTALRREVDDLRALDAQRTARGGAQLHALKAAEERAGAAEARAAAAEAARAAEGAALLARFARESEAVRTDLAGLRELLALKNDELRTVKRLAAAVLSQRGEVEQFFIDELAAAKAAVRARRQDDARAARAAAAAGVRGLAQPPPPPRARGPPRAGALALPRAAGGGSSGTLAALAAASAAAPRDDDDSLDFDATTNDAVALAELAPEDRERLLRALFARVCGGGGARAGAADAAADSLRAPFGIGLPADFA